MENTTGLALLRAPFPEHQISKLPKATKDQNADLKNDRSLGIKCQICKTWHHKHAVHLDYVGHAALTDRLLDADPLWNWEPLAITPDGLPAFDRTGGLWIRLTVCGHTRLGYGHAAEASFKDIGSREKEVIGDALRNAAMRFGAALELWHKGQLHAEEDESPPAQKVDRTLVMKCRANIQEHIANGRDMGALQEWETATDMGEEFASGVWAGLTSPERDKVRELRGKPRSGTIDNWSGTYG